MPIATASFLTMERDSMPRAPNTTNGTAKATPMARPHMRWNHSMKYMNLYSCSDML
jgi:hypothetical protein